MTNAKVERFAKPFQNMRSSRATELVREYPIHVVCDWQGDSPKVIIKYYLNVTQEDMKRGAGKAVQKAVQSVSDTGKIEATTEPQETKKPRKNVKNAGSEASKCRRDRNRTCTGYPTGS